MQLRLDPIKRPLSFLVVGAAVSSACLAILLLQLIERTEQTQHVGQQQEWREELSRKLTMLEAALDTTERCRSQTCVLQWSSVIRKSSPWVLLATQLRVGSDTADPSYQLFASRYDHFDIQFPLIVEQIHLSKRGMFWQGGSVNPDDSIWWFVRSQHDDNLIYAIQISLRSLVRVVNESALSRGAAIRANLAPNVGAENPSIEPFSKAGFRLTYSKLSSIESDNLLSFFFILSSALTFLLILASGSVVLELRKRQAAEHRARQKDATILAVAKFVTLGEMTSALSHELNQPLTAAEAFATASMTQLSEIGVNNEKIRGNLEQVKTQISRAGNIIRSVLTLAKSKAIEFQHIDLISVVEESMPFIDYYANEHQVIVEYQIQRDHLVYGDRTMIEQVLLNFAINGIEAMQATPATKKKLIISTVSSQLENGSSKVFHAISVRDFGHGVPLEFREKLFEPFCSTKPDGLGIGLSICKSVAEQHLGKIEFMEKSGGGSAFTFFIPAAGNQ